MPVPDTSVSTARSLYPTVYPEYTSPTEHNLNLGKFEAELRFVYGYILGQVSVVWAFGHGRWCWIFFGSHLRVPSSFLRVGYLLSSGEVWSSRFEWYASGGALVSIAN